MYMQVMKLQLLHVVIMWPRTRLREGIHEKFRRNIHKDFCMHVAVGQTYRSPKWGSQPRSRDFCSFCAQRTIFFSDPCVRAAGDDFGSSDGHRLVAEFSDIFLPADRFGLQIKDAQLNF